MQRPEYDYYKIERALSDLSQSQTIPEVRASMAQLKEIGYTDIVGLWRGTPAWIGTEFDSLASAAGWPYAEIDYLHRYQTGTLGPARDGSQ